ncbi:SLATT domain-containing protein [Kitasatospora sp. NA04385]|uniref:SLATT domain-containing protein n=1 Tax=Kitasatospora sp. NA04385 TaxID=2742135 RepID=UPI00158FB5D9|nr:SLATT domain-containing protein [Kitasatospora sp. NA04385]QKW24340.1 SLATT domain-containing protein [Kitasatospora sp. NA04385]
MQPEESPWGKEVADDDQSVPGAGGRTPTRRRADLSARQFPLGDWGEPAERLEELYRWSEERAVEAIDWYRRDRVWKRRWARLLRFSAAVFTVGGVTAPLVSLTDRLPHAMEWGYTGLALAAAALLADRAFGLTSGWMRDVSTSQALQRRLEAFQFDWASECVREVLGPTEGTAGEAAERCLGVLRRFCEDVSDMVRTETSEWMLEFRAGMSQLPTQGPGAWGGRSEGGSGAQVRVLPPPGTRPTMPRQRPPEGPLR